jgi:hypothetical protein
MASATRDYVTVVSGLPRSGTSLLMQMLTAGGLPVQSDDERPPDRHNPRGYLEYAPVKRLREDASFLVGAVGRVVKVVVPLVCALPAQLPNGVALDYRVVLVTRDPREVTASQDAMLGGADPSGLGTSRLVEIFTQQLGEFDDWQRARAVRLLRLEHAGLLQRPAAAAASLSGFLDGGLDVEAMAEAGDPALHRQRQRP